MRLALLLTFALFVMSFTLSEVTRYIYNRDGVHVEYGKEYGRLTSRYTSYWPNGNKKAEGEMRMNLRSGQWNLWDSTGKLIMTRVYDNGYQWSLEYPAMHIPTSSKVWYNPRSTDFFIKIKPDSVVQSMRLWRFIPYDQWNPIFMNNTLLDTLIACADRNAIMVGADDEMKTLMTVSEFYEQRNKCSMFKHVIGYRVKEDWYYDYEKQSAIFSIIAICPVMTATNEKDSVDLGWFAFDDVLRGKLATMVYMPRFNTQYPMTYEQMFFHRTFASEVYKYSNVKGKTINQLYPDQEKQALEKQYMEIAPFEWEEDWWLKVYGVH